jgi:uncharacterized membrane protein YhaH (DUF805 family)
MTFGQAISSGFQNYVNFSGRASRSAYWYWTLFAVLMSIASKLLDVMLFPGLDTSPINSLVGLALFLPGLSIAVRRLHDFDRTGWWLLIIFTVIGILVLLIWLCMRGTMGANRFGPDPLAIEPLQP